MALSGTLETFSLPDVLRLLASTKKSGLLALDGDRGAGRIWVDSGEIIAADAERAVVDEVDAVLFELLRFGDAAFDFDTTAMAPITEVRRDVEAALEVATARLEEWRAIESVVPSLDVRVRLVGELDDEVTIRPDVWRIVALVGTGATGHDLARHLGEDEYEICRALRDLVQDGLVELSDDEPLVPVDTATEEAFAALVHTPVEVTPVFEVSEEIVGFDPEPTPSPWEVAEAELRGDLAEPEPVADGEDRDQNLLLRFLSSKQEPSRTRT